MWWWVLKVNLVISFGFGQAEQNHKKNSLSVIILLRTRPSGLVMFLVIGMDLCPYSTVHKQPKFGKIRKFIIVFQYIIYKCIRYKIVIIRTTIFGTCQGGYVKHISVGKINKIIEI